MEFIGRVKKVLPLRSGTSTRTGNEWRALPFIFEFFENPSDRYADSVILETFDEKVIDNLKEGMELRCGFGHRTREYEGKVYNEVRLYKIESISKAAAPEPQQDGGTGANPSAEETTDNKANNDLPF